MKPKIKKQVKHFMQSKLKVFSQCCVDMRERRNRDDTSDLCSYLICPQQLRCSFIHFFPTMPLRQPCSPCSPCNGPFRSVSGYICVSHSCRVKKLTSPGSRRCPLGWAPDHGLFRDNSRASARRLGRHISGAVQRKTKHQPKFFI